MKINLSEQRALYQYGTQNIQFWQTVSPFVFIYEFSITINDTPFRKPNINRRYAIYYTYLGFAVFNWKLGRNM